MRESDLWDVVAAYDICGPAREIARQARRNYEMGFAQQCGLVGPVQICVVGDGVQGKGSASPASAIQKLGIVGFRPLFCSDNAEIPVRMVCG
jgi:hypothetical protein